MQIASPHTYDQVVEAEVAIEILNRARALLSARIGEIETAQPAEADRLRARRKDLHEILKNVRVGDDQAVRDITEYWGRLTKDETAFWMTMNG
jgi:seryl-tRNA synthetase